jgi:hypothetical protein
MADRPLDLAQWHMQVGRHLQMIEAGAEICERHVVQLLGIPEWPTRAADDLERVEKVFADGLERIRQVRVTMEGKQRVS